MLTGDVSLLADARSKLKAPADHMILPELITKEPLGPAVRQDDAQWFAVVRWTLMALIEAEELGLTSANVDAQARLHRARACAASSGSRPTSARRSGCRATGPIRWSRTSATTARSSSARSARKSDLKLARGLNNLWTKGGLMYSMPFR